MRANAIVPALALVCAAPVAAQGPPAPADSEPAAALTLDQAVERALARAPSLEQARALGRAAEADARAARGRRLPLVELNAGYTRQSDVPELVLALPGAPPRTIFPNIPDNYRTRLGASVPLYTGGRISALVEAAEGERNAAAEEVQSTAADLVLETIAAYWSLVTSRETERVLSDALAAYDAHLRDARNRREFGLAASNEVLAVQVERDRAELARLRATSAASLADANLSRLLDLPPGTRVEPVEPLERPAAPDVDVELLVTAALAARHDRAALASRVATADAQTRAERAARLPQLAASAGFDYANPNRKILPPDPRWNDTWDVSLTLSLNVFDGGRTSAAVARAEARAEAARRRLEDLDRRIRLHVIRAALDLSTAQAAVAVAERALEAGRENRRVAADRYREGLIQSSELLDAETALLRAGLDRTEALTQVRLAVAALDRAAGR